MSDRSAANDLYDTGREWGCNDFAAQWRVDAADLRRALNLCAFETTLTIGDGSAGRGKKELERIATAGEAFARALAEAGDASIFSLMVHLVPRELRNDLTVNPGRHRQMVVGQVQKLADQAKHMAGFLKATKKPVSFGATRQERGIVSTFADLWHRTHGKWPNVTDRKGGRNGDRRASNEAGRFVIAGAKEFFGVTLSDQRLRTVLATLHTPAAET